MKSEIRTKGETKIPSFPLTDMAIWERNKKLGTGVTHKENRRKKEKMMEIIPNIQGSYQTESRKKEKRGRYKIFPGTRNRGGGEK